MGEDEAVGVGEVAVVADVGVEAAALEVAGAVGAVKAAGGAPALSRRTAQRSGTFPKSR